MDTPALERFDFAIVGNNVAALVAALSLPDTCRVALINPTPVWGGHFGSTIVNGAEYDLGMNFFEFTSFATQSDDLASYDLSVRADCARFFHIVEKYITGKVDVVEVPVPKMICRGLQINDFIISNDFSGVSQLSETIRTAIIAELKVAVTNAGPLHASRKKKDEALFNSQSYYAVSIANHGETFHKLFIEPVCLKILGISSQHVPALYHRVAWAPLFYPETLLSLFNGDKVDLPPTRFHYPAKGHFSVLVEKLLSQIKNKQNITILESKLMSIDGVGSYRVNTTGGETILSDSLAWTMDLIFWTKLNKNIDAPMPEKTSLILAFINLNAANVMNNFSTLFITDPGNPIYRITNQTYSARRNDKEVKVVVEINYNYYLSCGFKHSPEEIIIMITAQLKSLSLIKGDADILKISVKTMMNAFVLPTFGNYALFSELYNDTYRQKSQNLNFMGPSAGFSTGSLNDQIVQGLKLGVNFK